MLLLVLLSIVKLSTISINYLSFLVKSTDDSDQNNIKITKNFFNMENQNFLIKKIANDETIFDTLNMLENNLHYKNSFLKNNEDSLLKNNENSLLKNNEDSLLKNNENSLLKNNEDSLLKNNENSLLKNNENSLLKNNEDSLLKNNENSLLKNNENSLLKNNEDSFLKNNENSLLKNNENSLSLSFYETKITVNDLNGIFLGLLIDHPHVVVSVRDYYDYKMNQDLFNSLDVSENTSVTILPASIAALTDLILVDQDLQKFCIISTVGIHTLCNFYEVKKSNGFFEIKNINTIKLENFGDVYIDKIIEDYVREKILERNEENIVLIPCLEKYEEKKDDLFLDISDICLEIKKNLMFDGKIFKGTEPEAFGKKDLSRKKFIEDLDWNFEELKKTIFEKIEIKDLDKFINKVNNFCKENYYNIKHLISSFDSSIINNWFNFENIINVQDNFILKGGIKFHKSKYGNPNLKFKSSDERIFSGKKDSSFNVLRLKNEIKLKNECINIIENFKTGKKYFKFLPEEKLVYFTNFVNSEISFESLKILEVEKFLKNFKDLEIKNKRAENDFKTRPDKVLKLENALKNVLKFKDSEFWDSLLEKKYQESLEYFETFKDDKNVLGDEFEDKAYSLEGIVSSRKKTFEKKKKEEEEQAKKNEENSGNLIDKEDNKEDNKEDHKEDHKEDNKENNKEDNKEGNKEFDKEKFKTEFSELFKDEKFKNMFENFSKNFQENGPLDEKNKKFEEPPRDL